ncbi:MAG: hypothetical protein R2705_13420 [Ilumatobacteraceae bacterium]
MRLHDAAVVDGRQQLLVEVASMDTSPGVPGRLLLVDVETGEYRVLDVDVGGWESGISAHVAAENGLVVGERLQQRRAGLRVAYSVGSTPAPTVAELGIESHYADCSTCPELMAISNDGRYLGWLDGTDLVRYRLEDAAIERIPLGEQAIGARTLDLGDDRAIIVTDPAMTGRAVPPILIDLTDPTLAPRELPGDTAWLLP